MANFHFRLPDAFRDPVLRPERTCHVVFDREVFQRVRDEDLGRVRGQPIKPVLAGFGEPVTDWLFQSALEAGPGESAFALIADKDWPHAEGWLLVYALRWLGPARRLLAADSLVAVFVAEGEPASVLPASDGLRLAAMAAPDPSRGPAAAPETVRSAALAAARQVLRERAKRPNTSPPAAVGLSLLFSAVIRCKPDTPHNRVDRRTSRTT